MEIPSRFGPRHWDQSSARADRVAERAGYRATRYRSDSEQEDIQVGWAVDLETRIDAPAYEGLLNMEYARPFPPS